MERELPRWYKNPKVLGLFAVSIWLVAFAGAAAYFVKRGKAYDEMAHHLELELLMKERPVSPLTKNMLRYLSSGSDENQRKVLKEFREGKLTDEVLKYEVEEKAKGRSAFNMGDYFGFTSETTVKGIVFGMIVGIIFGFIDNAGLFFGMDVLEGYFPVANWRDTETVIPKDSELQRAGLGNTFSDALGTFLAVFVGMLALNTNNMALEDVSLFSEFVGIILGCLLGVYLPYAIYVKLGVKAQFFLLSVVLLAFLGIFLYVYLRYYLPKKEVYFRLKKENDEKE